MQRNIKRAASLLFMLSAVLFIAAAVPIVAEALSHASHVPLDPLLLIGIGTVTPTGIAEINDLAKDYITDVYQTQFNEQTALKAQFSKLQNAQFTGKKWIFGVKLGLGGGASNAGANKSLPDATQGQYDQGEATVVRTYTRMALDGLAIEVTKKQKGSYRPALAEVMADRLAAHDLECNRQLFSNGDGKMAMVGGTLGASATQTLALDYGVTNGGKGTRHAYEGDTLAFYLTNGSLIGRKVVVTVDGNDVVLDSSITTTATTNYVSKSTADDDNKTHGECLGLLKAVSTGAYEAITHGVWEATVEENGGTLRELTDGMILSHIAQIRAKSRKTPNLAVTREGVTLKYSELFLPLRRIDGQTTQLVGGYKPVAELQHGGGTIPVITDLDCPNSRMFFLNTDSFRMADIVGSEWADMDGAQFRQVEGKDAIEGYVRRFWQLIGLQRNANGVLGDLEDIDAIERRAA